MNKPRLTGMDILSHLGMIGSTLSTNSLVPRAQTPAAITRLQHEFFDAGNVADPDVWSKYAQVMKRPSSMETMLQLWDEMSSWDLIAAALVQIVDEVVQTDNSSPNTLWYECNDRRVEDDLNDMRDRLDVETLISSQVWHLTALGNHYEKIDYSVKDGVKGLSFIHPFEIRRYWLERNRQCIGFKWKGHPPNKDDVFTMPDNQTPIERVSLSHSGNNIEDLWYPWDMLHFRRMFRLRSSEHGEPLFDEAQGLYKKLRLALDQMVVHRAQIQPDRYIVNIDTQDLPPTEQLKTIQRWKQSMRNKLSFGVGADSQTLGSPDEFRSFYNPWALDTIFYMARPKGFEHSIEKIGGTTQVPDVFDIELLIDLFYSIIGMPKSWFGLGQDKSNPPSGKALLAQDIRFLRKVKSIRKPIIAGYTWLAYFHCLLTGHEVSTLNIQAKMPDVGGLEDQMKIEMIKGQAEVLAALGDVMQQYNLPKEAWVELVFKKYLHLPDEVVDVFITSLPPEQELQAEGKKSAPKEAVLLESIASRLDKRPDLLVNVRQLTRKWWSLKNEKIDVGKFQKKASIIQVPDMKLNEHACVMDNVRTHVVASKGGKVALNEVHSQKNGNHSNVQAQKGWRRFVKATS